MSPGCACTSEAMDTAIANSVAAGITYAVAAGDIAKDASTFNPANHPEVITVSAMADFDGAGGGARAPKCRADVDETPGRLQQLRPPRRAGGTGGSGGAKTLLAEVPGSQTTFTDTATSPDTTSYYEVSAPRVGMDCLLMARMIGWMCLR